MTFGKRQLLVGALVVALGAAVYLNWQFSGAQPVAVTEESSQSKELGQTVYVNTEVSGETDAKTVNTESSESSDQSSEVSAAETSQCEKNDYYTSQREKRSLARQESVMALQDMTEGNASESAKTEAMKKLQELSAVIKTEADIESEIIAKGFADCLVSINNGSCSVIVPGEGLNDASAITIKDIVNRQGGIAFDKITITPFSGE